MLINLRGVLKAKVIVLLVAIIIALLFGIYAFMSMISVNDAAEPMEEEGIRQEIFRSSEGVEKVNSNSEFVKTPVKSEASYFGKRPKRFSELMTELLEAAESGDGRAFEIADRIYGRCVGFYDTSLFVGNSDNKLKNEAIQRNKDFCDVQSIVADPRSLATRMQEIRGNLLEKADPYALSRYFGTPDSLNESFGVDIAEYMEWAWGEAANTDDPILEKVLYESIFNRWDGAGLEVNEVNIANQRFIDALGDVSPDRARVVRSLAFEVAACRSGAECDAYGDFQESYCMYYDKCASHLPVDSFIREKLVNQSEFLAINELISFIGKREGK